MLRGLGLTARSAATPILPTRLSPIYNSDRMTTAHGGDFTNSRLAARVRRRAICTGHEACPCPQTGGKYAALRRSLQADLLLKGVQVTVAKHQRLSFRATLAKAKSAVRRGISRRFSRPLDQAIPEQASPQKKGKEKACDELKLRCPDAATTGKLIENLFAAPPADWTVEQQVFLMRALRRLDLLPERALYKLMGRLFANREIGLVHSIVDDASLGFQMVRDYYRVCLASYLADESIQLNRITNLYGSAKDSFLRYRILNQLLTFAVKFGAVDRIEATLSDLETGEYDRLRKTTVLGVSRLLIKNERHRAAANLLDRCLGEANETLRLYYLEPLLQLDALGVLSPGLKDFCASLRPSVGVATLRLLSSTYGAVDAADRANFERLIIKTLSGLPSGSRNLMDVRFSSHQRETLIETIQSHLVEQRPLSLLRLNDGEAYVYDAPKVEGIDSDLFIRDNEIRERHWWGSSPSASVRDDIVMRVRSAVERSDILGLPSIYRVVRDLPRPKQRYGEGRSQRGLIVVLGACGRAIPLDDKIVTEERCQQVVIDEAVLARLASMARSVVVVSCWPPDQLRLPLASTEHITVPPAQKLKRLDKADAPPLPQVYPRILAQIRAVSAPGTLVLVGAGIIGKFLAGEARESGAVAIDVGSNLDYMAGHKTRSVADLI